MSDVFFTSDEHYFHTNVIPYCRRPWGNYERFDGISRDDMGEDMLEDYKQELQKASLEMNEAMIENLNAVVKPADRVYHLGDFGMGRYDKLNSVFKRLKGQQFLIKGNHDNKETYKLGWQAIYDCKGIRIDGQYIEMYHFPQRSWNHSYHGAWHIFGHVHGRCFPWGKSCDVGVDSWDFKPVSFEELKEFMDKQPKLSEYARDSFAQEGTIWTQNGVRDINIKENECKTI